MARFFDRAKPDFLRANAAVRSGEPLTMACWARVRTQTPNSNTMIAISSSTGSAVWRLCHGLNGGTTPCLFYTRVTDVAGNNIQFNGLATIPIGSWFHACAAVDFAGSSTIDLYLNGVRDTGTAYSLGATTVDRTTIGEYGTGTGPSRAWDGDLAEVAVWSTCLTAGEVASLGKGYAPLRVRPSALVLYAPLVRPIYDYRNSLALSDSGTVVSDHPRIMYGA